jgi:hypothetical protein
VSAARLHLVPVRSREVMDFVRAWSPPSPAARRSDLRRRSREETGTLRAVAIVGRPVARHLDDGATLEVTRTASDSGRNANSVRYGASWRAAKALGYQRLITFTQAGESGASLRGVGWHLIASRPPRAGWHTPSRPRAGHGNDHIARFLWQAP